MIVRTIKVTRSRSVSLIFPAATSRSSALALNWGIFSFSHSSTATGHPSAHSWSDTQAKVHQADRCLALQPELESHCTGNRTVGSTHAAKCTAYGSLLDLACGLWG
jgi:hypothetical protein